MAELGQPELESSLLDILPGENANRIGKALRALKSFYLIESKHGTPGDSFLDLHPIIRQFIKREFPQKEREPFVTRVVGFLDKMISRLKPRLVQTTSFEVLGHWTRKVDLLTSIGKTEEAVSTLNEICIMLLENGYKEELIRAASTVFNTIDWAEACATYKQFDQLFELGVKSMVELGRRDTALLWIERYAAAIPGKSAQYICLCNVRCYCEWFFGDFSAAIRWGEEGERLKNESSVDTNFSCEHNLALARRDGGRVDEALSTFLRNESVESALTSLAASEEKDPTFYGNIGRCLYLKGDLRTALEFYKRSAALLQKDDAQATALNRGYARSWIGELAQKLGDGELAAISYRAAVCCWEVVAPTRVPKLTEQLSSVIESVPECASLAKMEAWAVEARFTGWLEKSVVAN